MGAADMLDTTRDDLVLGIVGTGAMGCGIAQIAAAAGLTVRLLDAREGAAAQARADIAMIYASLVGKGRMEQNSAEAAAARLVPIATEADLAGSDLVVEAIVEDLDAKRSLFARLEPIVGRTCVLATNTSSLSVAAIAAACVAPERVAGFHFFNPVPLMKLVEVIAGVATAPWVADALAALATRMGHKPVRAADAPGFLVNHASRGFVTEALRILQEDVAPFHEIDLILREAIGFRMGPFEFLDLAGLDISVPVMEALYAQFHQEPRYRPSYLLRPRLAAGLLGRKSGHGFYRYEGGKPIQPPAAAAVPAGKPRLVWGERPLRMLADAAGWPVDTGDVPTEESLCLVAPIGMDCTSAALRAGLDPERTVAVDPLPGLDRRRTLMTNPATLPEYRDSAHALLAADGMAVSCLRDSPGFVSQRVLAAIVNVGCEIAQMGIATPADIDLAVTLGLGYPMGPLAWGDAIGAGYVLTILERLQESTGDPRYRPSPWLARRARLGLSLLAREA